MSALGTCHDPSGLWTRAWSEYCHGAKQRRSVSHLARCSGSMRPLSRFGAARPDSSGAGVVKHGTLLEWLATVGCKLAPPRSRSLASWRGPSSTNRWNLCILDHWSLAPVHGLCFTKDQSMRDHQRRGLLIKPRSAESHATAWQSSRRPK